MSFENKVVDFLEQEFWNYDVHTESPAMPDIVLHLYGEEDDGQSVELKEKKQSYNLNSWSAIPYPEPNSFILDELTVRKLMYWTGLDSYVLIQVLDGSGDPSIFLLTGTMMLTIPKIRCNRYIGNGAFKGKWIINLTDLHRFDDSPLETAFETIEQISNNLDDLCGVTKDYPKSSLACIGQYYNESIPEQGARRRDHWKEKDYQEK